MRCWSPLRPVLVSRGRGGRILFARPWWWLVALPPVLLWAVSPLSGSSVSLASVLLLRTKATSTLLLFDGGALSPHVTLLATRETAPLSCSGLGLIGIALGNAIYFHSRQRRNHSSHPFILLLVVIVRLDLGGHSCTRSWGGRGLHRRE